MTVRSPRKSDARPWVPQIIVFVAVACLYGLGYLDFVEAELSDTRFELLSRAPSENLLLVEIDARSLQELPVWPWPRGLFAEAVNRLNATGAKRIAIDIDFSAHSIEHEDQALEAALQASNERVVLPAFMQGASGMAPRENIILSAPLPALARYATLASVNVTPESDGRVRSVAPVAAWGTTFLPAFFASLAERSEPAPASFYIDYGIQPSAIPRVSFLDILTGRFEPELVAGKNVMIGATAGQLSDDMPVPSYGVLPGVVVQALAFESLTTGRTLQRVTPGPILLVALLIALILGPRFLVWSWGRGLLVLAAVWLAAFAISTAVQAQFPIILEISPWLLSGVLAYVYALTQRLDQQDLRLLTQSLAIRRTDAFMSQVVEKSFDGILTFDENGMIVTLNRAAERIFGSCPEASVGGNLSKIMHSDSTTDAEPSALDLQRLRGGPHELLAKRADGQDRNVQVVVSEMPQDDQTLYIALVRDVSKRRLAEAKAKEAQARLVEAVESIQEGFALYDEQDRLALCNGKFLESFFGMEQPNLMGRSFEEIIRQAAGRGRVASAKGKVEAWVANRLDRHRSPEAPYEERFVDGTCVLISERRTLNGGTVAILTDISELKRQEGHLRDAVAQARTANRVKTEFLANMSHELRTPLNAIIGFSEVLIDEYLGPLGTSRYREYAKDICDSGRHLLGIINNVLDVSKIEAGRFELNCDFIEVRPIVEASLRLVENLAQTNRQTLSIELPDDLPNLYADELVVKQVLVNLLSNAVKFTPVGGTVSVCARVEKDEGLSIIITDNGIGIGPQDMPKAFAVFGQVESDMARRYEGSGLGLTLARSLMELHGGTLDLRSEAGVGTTVTIGFPADRVRSPDRVTMARYSMPQTLGRRHSPS